MSILNPIYAENEIKEDVTKIMIAPRINCTDNIIKLWKILFEDAPSVIKSTVCSSSLCQVFLRALPVVSANHSIISRQGFTALEKALQFYHKIYNVRCRFCNKAIATRFTVPKEYLFIELDIRDNSTTKKVKMCRLSDLPIHLNLKLNSDDGSEINLRFRLSGVAAYVTGHYFAYCRRLGGNWVTYNDMSAKPESAPAHVDVQPHGAFYILE
ncbi:uncharacterized protein LOC141534375 [Cotesia typhae]|uniref:uncharacterized protein LOC141534375 n=1 Tax=Cotesia typhae TaxID=2053667 RepID=UPI003D6966D3